MNPYVLKQWLEVASLIVAIAAALGIWRWLWPAFSRARVSCKNIVQGIVELPKLNVQLGVIAREVLPNGGSSLRDVVTRTETGVQEIRARQALLEATARARADSDPTLGMFECSEDGQNIFVSDTYCRWLNVSPEDLLGWGFLSYVANVDRDHVRKEWQACVVEHRVYSRRHGLIASDGTVFQVDTTARPIPGRWIGVIRKVDAK